MASTSGINIVLNIFFGTVVNAARGIAIQVSTKVDEFINNIQQAMNPQIVQLYSKGEFDSLQSLIDDNFRWNFSLYWLIALPIIFEIDYILELWLGIVPEYTGIFTIIIVIRSLLKCFERPINSLNFAIGQMKTLNLFAAISVFFSVVVVIILFLIGQPPYWAFIIDLLSLLCCIAYYMYFASKKAVFSLRHFFSSIFMKTCLVILITTIGVYLLTYLPIVGFARLLLVVVVSSILSSISLFFILFTQKNRERIISMILCRCQRVID